MSTITPEEQARCAERVRERQACAEKQAAQDAMDTPEEPALEPLDELEWLREQYVVLKQNNDSIRQAYSTVGQEASALRRALAARQPTLRERAAVEVLSASLALCYEEGTDCYEIEVEAARRAVRVADALIKELANG